MNRLARVINRIMFYGFFITGVVLLFYGTGRISSLLIAFGSFIEAVLILWVIKAKGINEKYLLYTNAVIWFNLLGEIFLYYSGIPAYDKVLHLLCGALLSAIVYDYYRKHSDLSRDSVFFTTLGLLAFWEIFEFSMDFFFGFQSQGVFVNGVMVQPGLIDTMYDLIWGSIGALFYLFFKKEKIDVVIKKDVKIIEAYAHKKIEPHYLKRAWREMLGFKI